MVQNARQLGVDGTMHVLRRILVEQFHVAKSPDAIAADEPLFSAGVGLSSMEGVELLAEMEREFDVKISEVEEWLDEQPTLQSVAQYLVRKSS